VDYQLFAANSFCASLLAGAFLVSRRDAGSGGVLGKQGKFDEQMQAYDELIELFGYGQDVSVQVIVAKTMIQKANTLDGQSRFDEEIEVYDGPIAKWRRRLGHRRAGRQGKLLKGAWCQTGVGEANPR
jgi:hypothetical protein